MRCGLCAREMRETASVRVTGRVCVDAFLAAQKRVTGGRWRRIMLGHVLAEQVLRRGRLFFKNGDR